VRKLFLHPIQTLKALARTREIIAGGGPRRIRVKHLTRPSGWILPVVEAAIEIEAKDGTVVDLHPVMPVPFALAWGERLAKSLGIPVVRDFDPEKIAFELSVPGRG